MSFVYQGHQEGAWSLRIGDLGAEAKTKLLGACSGEIALSAGEVVVKPSSPVGSSYVFWSFAREVVCQSGGESEFRLEFSGDICQQVWRKSQSAKQCK